MNTSADDTSPTIDCPCCGRSKVDRFDICDVCGWENDPLQALKPDYRGGANALSLNEAKKVFTKKLNLPPPHGVE